MVDLNCDMGEGCGNDAELMRYVTSANIACGYHAGDADTMRRTVELAIANGVAIGAHPGYQDRENFGRTSMSISTAEAIEIITKQLEALNRICRESGVRLHHLKPHGALYNQAAADQALAAAIAEAVVRFDPSLVLFGLSGSFLISEARAAGLHTASEVFADRTYRQDGKLTPRSKPNALIENSDDAVAQVMQMIKLGTVTAISGETVPIVADTVCIHGDGAHALDFASRLRSRLAEDGIPVRAISQ